MSQPLTLQELSYEEGVKKAKERRARKYKG